MIDELSTDSEIQSPFSNKQIELNDVIGFFFDQLPPGLKNNISDTYRTVKGKKNPLNEPNNNRNFARARFVASSIYGALHGFFYHASFSWQYLIYGMHAAISTSDSTVTWLLNDRGYDDKIEAEKEAEPSRSISRVSFASIAQSVSTNPSGAFSGSEN